MNPTALSVLAGTALALAGCVAPAGAPVEPSNAPPAGTGSPGSAGAGAGAEPAAALAGGPWDLFLTPELGFADAAPAEEARVTLTTAVNGPFTPGYPAWEGTLPRAAFLGAEVPVVLYVATNSASFRGNQVPVFADLPALFLELRVGGLEFAAETDGPATMVAGEVYEIQATLQRSGTPKEVPAGAPVALETGVIYSHVQGAAEFHFVLGPQHAARLHFP